MSKQQEIEYLRSFLRGAEQRIQQTIQHELKAINNFGVHASIDVSISDFTGFGDTTPKQLSSVVLSAEVK